PGKRSARPSFCQACRRAGRSCGRALVSLRRAGPADAHDPPVLRQERRDHRAGRRRSLQGKGAGAMSPAEETRQLLATLALAASGSLESRSPIDGQVIGSVTVAGAADVEAACAHANDAYLKWRRGPGPAGGGGGVAGRAEMG